MKLPLSIFLSIILLNTIYAQTGNLKGNVVNENNLPLANQSIWIKGTPYGGSTNEKGSFSINKITPGHYTLVCASMATDTVVMPLHITEGENPIINIKAKHRTHLLDDIVITATRTEKSQSDVAVPVKVITGEQIKQMGSTRLSEVLAEQTGMTLVSDHGTGIQMQGFSSEYTLILLNGEPLIGRTAGTFDLNRIAVGNIKKIEILKGPSSSLYGSEALAGVINIITEKPKDQLGGNIKTRYASNNTLTLTGDANYTKGKFGMNLFADRYSTSGYKLGATEDPTVAPYQNYTYQTNISYKFTPRLNLTFSGRLADMNSNGSLTITELKETFKVDDKGNQKDWNLAPSLSYQFNEKYKVITRFYSSRFHTDARMTKQEDGSIYDKSFFNQNFTRPELQFNSNWSPKQSSVFGIGSNLESVNSNRYTQKQYFHNLYAYAQHDLTVFQRLNIIAGLRLDKHSVYGTQLNPKIATRLKINDKFSFKASIGRGFKAPDFRQLYLNFTNPVEGYSVFGSEELKYQVQQFQQQHLISQLFIDPTTLSPLKSEYSISYNIGWNSQPFKNTSWSVNFFHNNINNMIATSPIAIKTNGQSVYGYFNLASVYTQGLETEFTYKPLQSLSISGGYQYLIAKDKDVLNGIEKGQYFQKDPDTWVTTKVAKSQYGGLFNRSKNMANVKLTYTNDKHNYNISIRTIYRGKYGFGDMNGNLILDAENEYVKGYWLVNIAASKQLSKKIQLQCGIDKIGNYTQPLYIPSLPGRIYFASLNISFNKENKSSNLDTK